MNFLRRGFTLVELLIVVAIIAVLSAVGLSLFTSSQRRGRDARRQEDLRQIQNAAEQYYLQCNKYPEQGDFLDDGGSGCAADTGTVQFLSDGVFPADPRDGVAYERVPPQNNGRYQVCADLEINPDGQVDSDWSGSADEDDFCVFNLQ